ncbi:ABC transporter substrate-binding protein [Streptomyces rugosispiralis]|uniref:ABC transporter substrate-binding protein n=1 Tax=Streptomyces rugosispiralis TaxID=2967341 RepID=A0ABT1UWF8_9ACTN|nr:ABC transporter substrate-binding protein [Streptomyces rugosispiralis]MCQ8188686.1 ABC transporter substrate-binding protein [Streptomyces rugosispiralis]
MHSVRRRWAAALLLLPLLAGCFATRDGSPYDAGAGAGAGAGMGGGRLRVAMAFPPAERFSPYGADATLLSRLGVTEGLTRLDGNGGAVPALAESWTRQSARGWLFTLREARFQDGTEVTPAAVAGALTHATRADPPPAALTGVTLTAEAVGERRVRVTTRSADSALPLRLSSPGLAILAPKAYRAKDSTGRGETTADGKVTVDPAGTATGPFTLARTTGATRATLHRFDDYWGGLAHASGLDVRFIADGTARTNALRSGEVDMAEAVPVSQAATLDKATLREVPTARTTALFLNTRSGPFADPAVRAAAREAVDASALAEDVYEGHADTGRGLFGPALTWAAGERPRPSGRPAATRVRNTSITLATYDNRPELPEVAQVLQQQLRRAGFGVKLEVREYSRLEGDALAGKFDAVVAARNTMLDTGDPVSYLADDFTCDGGYNLARVCDKAVDRAVAEAGSRADDAARHRAALAAQTAVLRTDGVVPLVHQRILHGVGASVRGVILDPYERTLVGTGTRR